MKKIHSPEGSSEDHEDNPYRRHPHDHEHMGRVPGTPSDGSHRPVQGPTDSPPTFPN